MGYLNSSYLVLPRNYVDGREAFRVIPDWQANDPGTDLSELGTRNGRAELAHWLSKLRRRKPALERLAVLHGAVESNRCIQDFWVLRVGKSSFVELDAKTGAIWNCQVSVLQFEGRYQQIALWWL